MAHGTQLLPTKMTPASMKIDLGYITKITAMKIRGQEHSKFVGPYSFIVKTSVDGRDFSPINANLNDLPIAISNKGPLNEARMHEFPFPVISRYVEIVVKGYKHWPRFAVEVYGASECQFKSGVMPIGVDRAIPKSFFNVPGGSVGMPGLFPIGDGMQASAEGKNIYFQLSNDLLWEFRGVATQARTGKAPPGDYAVHTFTIGYSGQGRRDNNGKGPHSDSFQKYMGAGISEQTFRGNDCYGMPTPLDATGKKECPDEKLPYRSPSKSPRDDVKHKYGIVTNDFVPGFNAKSVRLYPKTWGKEPMLSLEFFVTASMFDWSGVKDEHLARLECEDLFAATENSFKKWTQGLNGDNFVWRSAPKKIKTNNEMLEFIAYRKSAVRSRQCGSVTKEMVCYRTEQVSVDETCCMRKSSTALCKEWSDQASETRLF